MTTDLRAAPLRRALFLIENYLFNEDGEDERWLEEARDIVKAHIDTAPPAPAPLDEAYADRLARADAFAAGLAASAELNDYQRGYVAGFDAGTIRAATAPLDVERLAAAMVECQVDVAGMGRFGALDVARDVAHDYAALAPSQPEPGR